MDADAAISDLIGTAGDRLLRLAFQLCHDRSSAEDLVQQALEQVYRRWRGHASGVMHVEAYARRAVVNEYLRRRRLHSATELITEIVPDVASAAPEVTVAERDAMWRALGELPVRQRAALVLRYYEDLPDGDIAAALDCRQATVRSLIARGLHALRGFVTTEAAQVQGGAG